MKKTLILTALFLYLPFSAKGTTCTLKYLKDLIQPLHSPLLKPEDQDLIKSWFNSDLPKGEPEKRTFELYLQRRLEVLPEPMWTDLSKHIKKKYVFISSNTINGSHNPINRRITVKLPDYFRNSPIEYEVLTHEVEHAIESLLYTHKSPINPFRAKFWKYRIEQEYGAMLAEWNYMRGLPKEVRESLINEISTSKLSESSKRFGIRKFLNSDLSAEEYLQHEWAAGRYNPKSLRHLGFMSGLAGKMMVGTFGLFELLSNCAAIYSDQQLKKKHPFFSRYICEPIFRFQESQNP